MNFTQINLIKPIQRALTDAGFIQATEIQSQAIPHLLKGADMLGCAQTGTGKTAAFALPILQNLQDGKQPGISVLVLTPTRELALQIQENFSSLGKYLPTRCLAIFGGVSQYNQVESLKKGVDILIATPGRLLDLIQQRYIHLNKIETLVLDEADRMLDMGFINDIRKILAMVPKKRQTMLFSATMPGSMRKFAGSILHHPIEITVTPEASAAQTVRQSVYFVEKDKKADLLKELLNDKSIERSLVFTRTKHGANRLVRRLSTTGIYAAAIHGDKSQNARQKALEDFKHSRIRVLVATDVASRGIDIDELPHVVNYELPNVPETYVHRIGRTGRAGKNGQAVSFCDNDERNDLKNIQNLIGFKIPVMYRAEPDLKLVHNGTNGIEDNSGKKTWSEKSGHSRTSLSVAKNIKRTKQCHKARIV